MRFVIQCVENAEVEIEGKVTGKTKKISHFFILSILR